MWLFLFSIHRSCHSLAAYDSELFPYHIGSVAAYHDLLTISSHISCDVNWLHVWVPCHPSLVDVLILDEDQLIFLQNPNGQNAVQFLVIILDNHICGQEKSYPTSICGCSHYVPLSRSFHEEVLRKGKDPTHHCNIIMIYQLLGISKLSSLHQSPPPPQFAAIFPKTWHQKFRRDPRKDEKTWEVYGSPMMPWGTRGKTHFLVASNPCISDISLGASFSSTCAWWLKLAPSLWPFQLLCGLQCLGHIFFFIYCLCSIPCQTVVHVLVLWSCAVIDECLLALEKLKHK